MDTKTQTLKAKNPISFLCKRKKKRDFGIIIGTQILLFSAIYAVNNFQPYFHELHFQRMQTFSGRILIYFLLAVLIFQILFLVYIAYLYIKYKPIKSVSDKELPMCTIIVPAYNEGKLVYKTLMSIAESDYPKEKMEIWAIDDGSKDDTWYWINKANSDLNNIITVFQQPENKGKRHALHKGFSEGKGEIL